VRRERWLNQMIMEQQDVSVGAAVPASAPVESLRRGLSNEVRASLEAVRVAGVVARARARRQTLNARIALATMLVGLAVFALAFGPRVARAIHARRHAVTAAAPMTVAAPAAPAAALPEPIAPASVAPPVAAPVAATTDSSPVAAPPKPGATADEMGCDTRLMRHAPWRLSAEACARAFDLDPTNARLALAIAQAEQAHGTPEESARWAERALSLNPDAAEAYVLIARAAARRGHADEARAAYRRYLELAPRGWHQTEARASQK
jgi:tetratricopeptide (TPR) repeat protein